MASMANICSASWRHRFHHRSRSRPLQIRLAHRGPWTLVGQPAKPGKCGCFDIRDRSSAPPCLRRLLSVGRPGTCSAPHYAPNRSVATCTTCYSTVCCTISRMAIGFEHCIASDTNNLHDLHASAKTPYEAPVWLSGVLGHLPTRMPGQGNLEHALVQAHMYRSWREKEGDESSVLLHTG